MSEKAGKPQRPPIADIADSTEFRRWYWRKDELVAHARALGLKTTGGKFLILDRIAHFLATGETAFPGDRKTPVTSRFDWHGAALSRDTIITDSYRNTQNVRRFFRAEIGPAFRFNIAFMEWMRGNAGKTLADACDAYRAIRDGEKTRKAEIPDHNQFNRYTRDFLADNPDMTMADVRRIWALKIQQTSETGRHVYDRADLALD